VPLTVEVVEVKETDTWDPTDVSKYHIPTNQTDVLAPVTNSSNSTNETLPENTTTPLNNTLSKHFAKKIIDQEDKTEDAARNRTRQEVYMNITSISQIGRIIVDLDRPVQVPDNYTDLPTSIFDV